MRKRVHTISVSVLMLAALELVWPEAPEPRDPEAVAPIQLSDVGQDSLVRVDPYSRQTGKVCPLKRTAVQAAINGELARVTVTQLFENSSPDKIEAVYVFPLPAMAAVDRMEMKVGSRLIKAVIKKREEARRIYEQARRQGHVASLLEQERPNIFTQSVTNIEPGAAIQVTLSYVETLRYEDGRYEFSFPMVVGPRYIPGTPVARQGTGWSADTGQVPDASRVTPKLAPPAIRAGHDLTLAVSIEAGVPIGEVSSNSHEIFVERAARPIRVGLRQKAVIPNKDFLLKFDVGGESLQDGFSAHRQASSGDGFFRLHSSHPNA